MRRLLFILLMLISLFLLNQRVDAQKPASKVLNQNSVTPAKSPEPETVWTRETLTSDWAVSERNWRTMASVSKSRGPVSFSQWRLWKPKARTEKNSRA